MAYLDIDQNTCLITFLVSFNRVLLGYLALLVFQETLG